MHIIAVGQEEILAHFKNSLYYFLQEKPSVWPLVAMDSAVVEEDHWETGVEKLLKNSRIYFCIFLDCTFLFISIHRLDKKQQKV